MKKTVLKIVQLPYSAIVIAPFVLLAPVLFTGKALFWGIPSLQFIPWWKWAFDTLLSGNMPLWNPTLGMGSPLIANYQSAIFYPPYWLHFLFYAVGGIASLAWSQALVVALHIAWAGVGMALLVRCLGMSRIAQTISGLAFSLSGFIVARGWFYSINSVVVWLPWILLFAYKLVNDNEYSFRNTSGSGWLSWWKITPVIKLGIVIGIQLLAGHAQLSWYTLMLTAFWVTFWSWQKITTYQVNTYSRVRNILKNLFLLVVAIVIGVSIAAIQLLPTAEYLFQSQRAAEVDFDTAMTLSFWPWRFLGFIAPDLFGSPVTGDFVGYVTYWEDAIYIGLLPILLALGVLFGAVFRKKREPDTDGEQQFAFNQRYLAIFLLVIISLSFLFALGKNTPVFPWLYQHVPTFDMFKSPTRFSIWAIFALSLLAGIGVERWRRPTGLGLYWMRLSVSAAFAVSLGAGLGWVFLRNIPNFQISFVRAMALAGFWGLGAVVLLLLAPENLRTQTNSVQRWQLAVVLWVVVDLLVAGRGLNPGITLDYYTQTPLNAADVRSKVANGRSYLLADDEYKITYEQYFTYKSFNPRRDWTDLRGTFLPNLNVVDGISVANNYDPMVPGRYARWMDAIAELDEIPRDDILDLMAISVIEKEDPDAEFGVVFMPRESAPRVSWVPCAYFVADGEAAWEMVFSSEVNFNAEVILEKASPSQDRDCLPSVGIAEILEEQPNRIEIKTESRSVGWLVLSDVWYPGWQAEIDEVPTPILRANYLFRAVEVPTGEHIVTFVYRPLWYAVGLAISVLTCLGLLLMLIVYRIGSRK